MGETGKRFIWNVSTSFVSRAAAKCLSFVITILLINHLGAENFGIYVLILNFSAVWMVMMDFGWVEMMIREISSHRDQTRQYFSTHMIAQQGLSIFSILLFLIVITVSGYETSIKTYLLIITIGIYLFGFTRPFHALLVAHESLDRIAFLSLFATMVGSVFMIAGLILKQPLVYFIWVFNVFVVMQCTFYFLFGRVKLRPWKFSPDFNLIKPIALMSLPFTGILIVVILLRQLDVIMLSKMISKEACGIYASASKFVYPFILFSEAVHWSIYPILSREKNAPDRAAFDRALMKAGKYLIAIALYLAAIICLLAGDIITGLLKPEYAPGIKILRVLAWYLPFYFVSRLLFYALVSLNKMRFILATYAAALAFFIVSALLLVPLFSFMGMAVAVVVTNFLLLMVFWVAPVQKKILSFRVESLPRLLVSIGVMAFVILLAEGLLVAQPAVVRLVVNGMAGTLAFVLMLFVGGFISRDERRQLFSFLNR